MPGRILIVDDNVTRRISLAARLSGAFYEIQVACTALEALELLDHWQPGMILIADELESMPTGRLLRRLRVDARAAEVTLLVVTAPGAHLGRSGLLTAGADDVIARNEPQEVFRARMRAQQRAREVMNTLKLRGNDLRLPGLSESRARFPGVARASFIAPDAATARDWRRAFEGLPGFRLEFLDMGELREGSGRAAPPGQPDRSGLLVLGLAPDNEGRGLRLLAEMTNRSDRLEQEILVLAPGASPYTQAQAYDIGAGAVMPGPFDAAEIAARMRLLQARLARRRALRRALAESLRASVTDPLTGLHNRRFALPRLAQISQAAAMRGEGFAVLVADLDHFKAVNDRYGHGTGDIVLQWVAQILRRNLRNEDVLARIGGEEFLAILPGVGPEAARQIAGGLCTRLREAPLELPELEAPLPLTISVGLTTGGAGRRCPEELIADADRALYAAKRAGRDQVVCHPPLTPPQPAIRRAEARG
ncbi:response regulator receiver modulated diguanylate cyclase [Pseudooceanicola antarcticus]|nr:diguanylate cyclase [Pseudooceanicola antarcticus]SNY57076.1 response regulator receiver modulated diguanylate cyclase [Pseudooceanicola antarcticus]